MLAQDELGIPRGTIRATVLIETILAAFEMDEILYELREHSAGLNCGRWDYIFTCIKKFAHEPRLLPRRPRAGHDDHALPAGYAELLIKTCHRRGVHAMGGMAAQIPIKNDAKANDAALAKVRADKEREATDGHDGTWVAHPGLVPVAKEVFDRLMPSAEPDRTQKREDVHVGAADLLQLGPSSRSPRRGLRLNIDVAIRYIEAWLAGQGAVPINNLMEDAATAEISRSQVWQWMRSPKGELDDGRKVTRPMVARDDRRGAREDRRGPRRRRTRRATTTTRRRSSPTSSTTTPSSSSSHCRRTSGSTDAARAFPADELRGTSRTDVTTIMMVEIAAMVGSIWSRSAVNMRARQRRVLAARDEQRDHHLVEGGR